MKKYLGLLLSILPVLLGGAVYLFALMPAVTYTSSNIISGTTATNYNFYDLLSGEFGLGIAIMVVLSVAVMFAIFGVVLQLLKQKGVVVGGVAVLSALAFLATGIMFFFVTASLQDANFQWGGFASGTVTLAAGAVVSAVVAFLSALAQAVNVVKALKK